MNDKRLPNAERQDTAKIATEAHELIDHLSKLTSKELTTVAHQLMREGINAGVLGLLHSKTLGIEIGMQDD